MNTKHNMDFNQQQPIAKASKPHRGIAMNHNQTAVTQPKPKRGTHFNHNQTAVVGRYVER